MKLESPLRRLYAHWPSGLFAELCAATLFVLLLMGVGALIAVLV